MITSAFQHLKVRARQRDVTIDQTSATRGSLLGFGRWHGAPVVLKITKQQGDEWHAGEVLQAFNGQGAVRVYESDAGAVLLERLEPGRQLVELVQRGQDDEATGILGDVMRQLVHHVSPTHCPTVLDWARGFDRYLASGDRQIPVGLVNEARDLYQRLAGSQRATMLLHGDLQHYNVLFDSARGWVSIDPKGVVGELEYEVGAILRNPVEQPDLLASTTTIERRLDILVKALSLDYARTISWSFAQAALPAIWEIEDSYSIAPDNFALRLAHTLRPMLH
ncbi:MAG: aminoglycoside phosphotransferase family protein [Pyrinomonadaceae bacterium]